MTKAIRDDKMVQLGTNVVSYQDGDMVWFGVDLSVQGQQSEGSKGLDRKGNPKTPNELVGSTRSYAPVADGRVLIHFIRPMTVQAVRKARATAELDNDDASIQAAIKALKDAGIDTGSLGK